MNTINQKPELSIEAFKIKNFKGIRELELKNLPTNAPWIFITGENGFGKTSVLQAIASVMAGEERHKFEYFQAQKGKVGIQVKLHAFDSFYGVFPTEGGKNNSWEHFPEMMFNNENGSLLACYGPSRLDTYTQCSSKEKPGITESLYDSSSLLINIEYQIHTLTPNLILDSPIFGYSEIFL